MSARIAVKRVYEPSSRTDGHRILVDRLWPRGMRKEEVSWHEWRKDLAPTAELRRWYGHDPLKFADFARRYRAELRAAPVRSALRDVLGGTRGRITLLTATADVERSGAEVLAKVMRRLDTASARRGARP